MRWHDFRLLWSAMAVSRLGSMCSSVANPLLALTLTNSPVFAGWVAAASAAPRLLMHLPAGWCVDRFNRRRLMFVSQFGRLAVCTLLLCALALTERPTVPLLLVVIGATLCDGVFLVLYSAAEITAVQRVVSSAELPSALAMNEARSHIGLLAGKPLGGFLFGLGKAFPYCVDVAAALWSIFALRMMKEKNYQPRNIDLPAPGTAGKRAKVSMLTGLQAVLLSPFLRMVVVVCAFGNFFFQTILLLLVVLAKKQHIPSVMIGLLLATSGVAGLAGSAIAPLVSKRLPGERRIVVGCAAAWALLTLVVAVFTQPVIGLIAWGCLSLTGGYLNVAIMTYQTRRVPDHMIGRVMSINRFLTSGAVPLGALSAGYIVAGLNPQTAAWLVFWVIFAVAALIVPVLLHPRLWLPARVVDSLKRFATPRRAFDTPLPRRERIHAGSHEQQPVPVP